MTAHPIHALDLHYNMITKLQEQQKHDKERITYVNQLVIDLEGRHGKRIDEYQKRWVEALSLMEELEKKLTERISRLEKQINTKFTVNPITNKLELLLPSEKRLTDILREQLPNHDVEVRFVGNVNIPKKRMTYNFPVAVDALFAGKKITREAWGYDKENYYVYVKLDDSDSLDLDIEDLQANDWYIIE